MLGMVALLHDGFVRWLGFGLGMFFLLPLRMVFRTSDRFVDGLADAFDLPVGVSLDATGIAAVGHGSLLEFHRVKYLHRTDRSP